MTNRETDVREQADGLITSFEIDHLADEYSRNLSGGERKLLAEPARTLMLDPTLLIA
ncbi:MAG: hypothetical protein U5K28_05075 [Halobacteriales archaeon]|nr:hypothetical protein [Halobacteriales archaeon]